MQTPNSQFGADVEYNSLDRGTPAWGVKPGPGAIPEIPAVPGDVFNAEDFEGTLWTEIPLFSGDWALATDESHSPTHSYKSATIGNNATSSFTVENNAFNEQVSFWVKTKTEAGFDTFKVFIDAVEVYSESGINDWHYVAIPTDFGYYVEFRYTKDFSSAPPGDACWVDDIGFGTLDTPAVPGSPAHPLVYAPFHIDEVTDRLLVDVEFPAVQAVSATNLDIRDLVFATDKVDVSGSSVSVSNFPATQTVTFPTGTLTNGTQVSTSGAGTVSILASNANRRSATVQNVGLATVRIGVSGVTTTTGYQLVAGSTLILEMPYVPTQELFMIREGAVNGTVLVMETT